MADIIYLPSQVGKFSTAAVSTDGDQCAAIGKSILKKGGSAMDAAIAILFCNGVTDPQSTGLGGGFLMTVYIRETQSVFTLNAREAAPANASLNMFQGDSQLCTDGPLAIAVPSAVKGYWVAHQKFGKLKWSTLLQPAIKVCKEGFRVTDHLARSLQKQKDFIREDAGLSKVFLNPKTKEVWLEGDIIKRPTLAKTLEILAKKGAHNLYSGELGKRLVQDIQNMGGIITRRDLRRYRAKWENPVSVHLRNGMTMYSVPPPGSGAILGYILNILDCYNMSLESVSTDEDAILTYHRIIEAFKHAFGMRTELGDPVDKDYGAHIKGMVKKLTSRTYAEETVKKIHDHMTYNDPSYYGAVLYQPEDHGTAHTCVLAPNGDAVSVTSTINRHFGSKHSSTQTGIILNNDMDDFCTPNIISGFGIPPSPANFMKPGKRPFSSMSPAIFVDDNGDVKFIIGAAGGTKIPASMTNVIISNLWFEQDINKAIDLKRIHHQLFPMLVSYEYGFPEEYLRGLESLGHTVEPFTARTAVRGIVREEDGFLYASTDSRKPGSIDGY